MTADHEAAMVKGLANRIRQHFYHGPDAITSENAIASMVETAMEPLRARLAEAEGLLGEVSDYVLHSESCMAKMARGALCSCGADEYQDRISHFIGRREG